MPQAVEEYNDVYRQLEERFKNVRALRPLGNDPEIESLVQSDGYHLNSTANERVSKLLDYQIDLFLSSDMSAGSSKS